MVASTLSTHNIKGYCFKISQYFWLLVLAIQNGNLCPIWSYLCHCTLLPSYQHKLMGVWMLVSAPLTPDRKEVRLTDGSSVSCPPEEGHKAAMFKFKTSPVLSSRLRAHILMLLMKERSGKLNLEPLSPVDAVMELERGPDSGLLPELTYQSSNCGFPSQPMCLSLLIFKRVVISHFSDIFFED